MNQINTSTFQSQLIFQLILINSYVMKRSLQSLSSRLFSTTKLTVQQLFEQRRLLYQMTSQDLGKEEFVQALKGKAVYCGYDPTSDSLHLGNLVSIIMMGRLSLLGLRPIILVGGATGLIGDPSGKIKQRALLDQAIVESNIQSLQKEISSVYTNLLTDMSKYQQEYNIANQDIILSQQSSFKMINNYQFYKEMNAIRFLRDVGKYFRMGPLMNKQAVAHRLNSEEGISYAQFSYSIIQAYDFLKLYQQEQCMLQFGGSDQWGNITNGCDLVRKITGKEVYGITMPLLLTKSGQKFGKSEGNALYLNPKKTSTEAIFNYFLNSSDEDVERYLSIFTLYPKEKIGQIMSQHLLNKQKKLAQTILAESVLKLIRSGQSHISKERQFFTLSHEELVRKDRSFFAELFSKMSKDNNQYFKISKKQLSTTESLVDFLVNNNLAKSKTEVRRQAQKGGFYINNKRVNVSEVSMKVSKFVEQNVLFGEYVLIRWGKKKYQFVQMYQG